MPNKRNEQYGACCPMILRIMHRVSYDGEYAFAETTTTSNTIAIRVTLRHASMMSTMKETQTQRPFLLESNRRMRNTLSRKASFFSDLWVWVSWIVLI